GATRRSGGPDGAGVPGESLRAVAMDRTLPTPRAARCRGSSPQGERVARGEVVARTLGVGTPAFGALVLAPQRGPFGGLLRRAVARAACGGRLGGSAHGAEELRDDDGRGGGGVEGHRGPPGAVGAAEVRPMTLTLGSPTTLCKHFFATCSLEGADSLLRGAPEGVQVLVQPFEQLGEE